MKLSVTPVTTKKFKIVPAEQLEVETIHLPALARRFSCMTQLQREGEVIKAKHQHLADEVDYTIAYEAQRRSLSRLQRS